MLFATIVHFGLVAIHANPYPISKSKLDYYAEWYSYPFFTQNWNLFAPVPNTNYKLFVEYEDKEYGSHRIQKKDIFQEILFKHQTNRLKGYGPLLLAFSNSIHYFEKNTDKIKSLNGPILNAPYFDILKNSALNYIRSTQKTKIEKMKMILYVQSVDTNFTRVYYN
ncbi:DUF5819 family protein [Aurantibacillus circumpalustris]|uniref:DUF5819 family protein n=1 Tax=Aurantibacillus circumpalustris TaxID=3036359 RepID=UPI00295A96F9|nr:DUF5819 family protein [Aurantibacillus circumpalustris]